MSPDIIPSNDSEHDVFELVELALEARDWHHDRDSHDAIHCIVPTRWGEMGAMFVVRNIPSALHFSLTLDVKPQIAKRAAITELVVMMNERLWLGHFDYWLDSDVVIFRHTLPLADRMRPNLGEISAVLSASLEAADRFVPAFNFVIWAGKTSAQAIEAVMFETDGEA